METVVESRPPVNLRAETWTAHPSGAMRWATVTPIVFDVHPKAKDRAAYDEEVSAMIAQSCDRIGLPPTKEVVVTPVSAHLGAPPAHEFPRLARKGGASEGTVTPFSYSTNP